MTPNPAPTVEQIAGRLTKAQREAVLTLREPDGRGKWPARHALVGKGLFEYRPWKPTALCLAVKAFLAGEGKAS